MAAEPRFDESIHASTRLRLCAVLRPLDSAEFHILTDILGMSEASLSKTIRNLVELGYATTSKQTSPQRDDSRLTTTVQLTPAGKTAFDGHLAAISALANTD
ncbi:transcriptional regulator [Salinibacterium sp. PAMC 21357]|uniref:transcriptional regulator n=1 Tax=Salinibacterium sp. PAMC 21357 TaxID=1112215 RepID=UPI000289ED7F|nr:transcriptional regulator [Salinibacterium sp. PAMC 21357]